VNYLGPNITFTRGLDTYTVLWQFRYAKESLGLAGIYPTHDLAEQNIFMDDWLDGLANWLSEQENDLVLGDRESCTLKEYPMLYQNYTFLDLRNESRMQMHGIIGVYICMESNYWLTVIYQTDQSDVYTDFFNFLDSIEYKGPPRAIPML
jgi:hypothetical protein